MRVKFLQTRVVDDFRKGTDDEERYEEGGVYDLPDPSAQRWISRKAAVPTDDAVRQPVPAETTAKAAPGGGRRGKRGASRPRAKA